MSGRFGHAAFLLVFCPPPRLPTHRAFDRLDRLLARTAIGERRRVPTGAVGPGSAAERRSRRRHT